MAKQSTEEELNIKRFARRRLIGAIALALAIVVILPMVLDSEPKPSGQDIDLRIPDVDKAGEFVPDVAVSEVVEANAESAVFVSPIVVSEVIAAPVEKPPVALPVASGHITKQEVKKQSVATPEPEVVKAEVRPTEDANYVVQVGAFSNAATATQEADKLKAWGFKAYTELIGGTTRVRVGPYAERDKAEKVRLLLEKRGLHPVITALK